MSSFRIIFIVSEDTPFGTKKISDYESFVMTNSKQMSWDGTKREVKDIINYRMIYGSPTECQRCIILLVGCPTINYMINFLKTSHPHD